MRFPKTPFLFPSFLLCSPAPAPGPLRGQKQGAGTGLRREARVHCLPCLPAGKPWGPRCPGPWPCTHPGPWEQTLPRPGPGTRPLLCSPFKLATLASPQLHLQGPPHSLGGSLSGNHEMVQTTLPDQTPHPHSQNTVHRKPHHHLSFFGTKNTQIPIPNGQHK